MCFTNLTLIIENSSCIRCMFCLSVACTTFHCPSPPIPSHFPAMHTAHCILHIAYCILHPSAYFILGAFQAISRHCTLQVHTAHCILRAWYCTLHIAYCILHTAHCILQTARCTPVHTSYLVHSAYHRLHCILHTAYCRARLCSEG